MFLMLLGKDTYDPKTILHITDTLSRSDTISSPRVCPRFNRGADKSPPDGAQQNRDPISSSQPPDTSSNDDDEEANTAVLRRTQMSFYPWLLPDPEPRRRANAIDTSTERLGNLGVVGSSYALCRV